MAIVSSQVRFTTPSGVNVNTFHFNRAPTTDYPAHSDAVATALTNFYNGGGTASIGANMSAWVSRSVEIRNYDPNTPPIRTPTIYSFTLQATNATAGSMTTPTDVAMCLSYHAGPPVSRRRRGRIYLTGAQSTWFLPGNAGQIPTWNMGGAGTQVFAANLAMTTLMNANVGWCIFSRAGNAYYPIVGGYIDSEPDTQRRRGATVTTRNSWGT